MHGSIRLSEESRITTITPTPQSDIYETVSAGVATSWGDSSNGSGTAGLGSAWTGALAIASARDVEMWRSSVRLIICAALAGSSL